MRTCRIAWLSLLITLSVASPLLVAGECKTVEGDGFGTLRDPVTVEYDKLTPDTAVNSHPAVELGDESGPKLKSFFTKLKWGSPFTCWEGSTLRDGVTAYWFPNVYLAAKLEPPAPETRYQWYGRSGVHAWYTKENDSFYIYFFYNSANAYGPFKGNPVEGFKKAIKPRRSNRNIAGVSLSILSQRWQYPDPKDARSPRDLNYRSMGNALSGQEREIIRLNTFFTRIRLTNNSSSTVFYLADPAKLQDPTKSGDSLYGLPLKYVRAIYTSIGDAKWRILNPGDSVDVERQDHGEEHGWHRFVTFVNTEPVFWDEIEVSIRYPTMFRPLSLLDDSPAKD